MLISRSSDYALRALIYLATQPQDRVVPLKEIAGAQGVPQALLSKLLQQFRKEGVIRSYRGVTGGYTLERAPEEITVRSVIELVDGPLLVFECMTDREFCEFWKDCSLLNVFKKTQLEILAVLDKVSLSDCLVGSLAFTGPPD